MFEELLKIIGDNEQGKEIVAKIQSKYKALETEIGALDTKANDIKNSRDKLKEKISLLKKSLGIKEEEINEDLVKEKIDALKGESKKELSDIEASLKGEIGSLEETLKTLKADYENKLSAKDGEVLEKVIDLELYKNTSNLETVNGKAKEFILNELKNGISLEDGKLIYKDNEGKVVRKDGVPITLSDKLEEIKASDDFSFMFKADVQSGSGTQTFNSGNAGNAGDIFSQIANS